MTVLLVLVLFTLQLLIVTRVIAFDTKLNMNKLGVTLKTNSNLPLVSEDNVIADFGKYNLKD